MCAADADEPNLPLLAFMLMVSGTACSNVPEPVVLGPAAPSEPFLLRMNHGAEYVQEPRRTHSGCRQPRLWGYPDDVDIRFAHHLGTGSRGSGSYSYSSNAEPPKRLVREHAESRHLAGSNGPSPLDTGLSSKGARRFLHTARIGPRLH